MGANGTPVAVRLTKRSLSRKYTSQHTLDCDLAQTCTEHLSDTTLSCFFAMLQYLSATAQSRQCLLYVISQGTIQLDSQQSCVRELGLQSLFISDRKHHDTDAPNALTRPYALHI